MVGWQTNAVLQRWQKKIAAVLQEWQSAWRSCWSADSSTAMRSSNSHDSSAAVVSGAEGVLLGRCHQLASPTGRAMPVPDIPLLPGPHSCQ